MNAAKRNRFWQLHSLLGISLGLPLFVIFVAGTLAFLEPLAINWTQPRFAEPPAQPPKINPTIERLLENRPHADNLSVVLAMPDRPVIDVHVRDGEESMHYWIDPHTLDAVKATPHESDLFHFFVDLHYFDFVPFGQEITGLIAALFFTIILTGAVYQWRSIRTDAHPRNLSLGRKSRWKNIHRFTSLFTLPYQVLFSVTGASLTLGLFLAAPAIHLFFDGDQSALNQTLFPARSISAEPEPGQARYPVDQARSVARDRWPASVEPTMIQITARDATENAPASKTIIVRGKQRAAHFVGTHLLTLDGDLDIIHDQSPTSHLAPMLIEAMVNLHFATFHSLAIKVLFVVGGLVVSLSIAAGVLILLHRRLQGRLRHSRGTKCLAVLTHWTLGGLPLAIALSLHAALIFPSSPLIVFAAVISASLLVITLAKNSLPWHATLSAAGFVTLPLTFALVHGQSPLQWGSEHAFIITLFNGFFLASGIGIYLLRVKLSRPLP